MFKNQPQHGNQPKTGYEVIFLYKHDQVEHVVSGRITTVSENIICAEDTNGKDYIIERNRILKVKDRNTTL
jgi:hypothetical protein